MRRRSRQLVVGDADVAELHGVARHAVEDRLRHGVRLLVDLLEHEGLVAALLGGGVVPVDVGDLALEPVAVGVHELGLAGAHRHELVVVQELDVAGLGQEGRYRRGDEGLVVAHAHDQRALLARAHEHLGFVGGHRDERVVAAELVVRHAHGLDQVAVVVARDQVRDHLGVGVGGELSPLGLEAAAERDMVLHDAVEDDVDAIVGVEVRMGVGLAHTAVRGPARVTDPGGGLAGGHRHGGLLLLHLRRHRFAQEGQVAHRAYRIDVVLHQQRQARGVVAPVLELLEPLQEKLTARPFTDISDDSTHGAVTSSRRRIQE